MIENTGNCGSDNAETGHSADQWLAAMRERALAHARVSRAVWPRGWKWFAVTAAVLALVLLAVWLRHLMQAHPAFDDERIEVRLIDAPPPEPELPVPPPIVAQLHTPVASIAPRRANTAPAAPAPVVSQETPNGVQQLRLYNIDGSIIVPPETDKAAVADTMFVPKSTAPSALMLPHRPLKIRPNHFAGVWKSGKTIDLFDRLNELIDDHLTVKKEMTTPWGSKIKCEATYLFIIAVAGCGWGFPPPPGGRPTEHWKPATELDEK